MTEESGKEIGGETQRSRIELKTGEERRYGAMSRPKGQESETNLDTTLHTRTIGGKR